MLEQPLIETAKQPRVAAPGESARAAIPGREGSIRRRAAALAALVVLLLICFGRPLGELVTFVVNSQLYSHILLIPFISAYLVWLKRSELELDSAPVRGFAAIPLMAGLAAIGGYGWAVHAGWKPPMEDYLAVMMLALLALLLSGCFMFLGSRTMRAVAFPAAFLLFTVPFPEAFGRWLESFFQHGSAEAAYAMFKLSGMPVFRQGLEFQLPGFSMQVAPECSGIHSSLVLFITSLLAGHLLLQRGWSKAVLVLAVVPLALLRNGFRILVLGQLCVQLNPEWIHSSLHKRGGPLFFALSLVPFLLLLLWLRKLELRLNKSIVVEKNG